MLYLLNSAILPLKEGEEYIVKAKEITIQEARELLHKENFVSAVGHQATAELLSNVLGVNIPVNRIAIKASHGDKILAFSLKQRLPEGVVIKTTEELEKIGYELWLFEIQ
ncbi:DNA binding protein [Betalipothrixvirus pozzuoliense]|uniref:DUF1874 domain-containing protein n=1 Tax=Betalipothrixvirus pozzuoliense TaxID=346882 RepID=A7WKH0_9VIRU|nr:DNA binding protein [Acidianus filamentous virus 6]CAJ31570.1 conserved hypothetical protein [Acidianus filamentous virus 6]